MGYYVSEESYTRHLIRQVNKRCKRDNRYFALSYEQFSKLIKGNCVYCGKEPVAGNLTENKVKMKVSSIDRVDSSKGYTIDNVVSCCITCNFMKGVASAKEYIDNCRRVCVFTKENKNKRK